MVTRSAADIADGLLLAATPLVKLMLLCVHMTIRLGKHRPKTNGCNWIPFGSVMFNLGIF